MCSGKAGVGSKSLWRADLCAGRLGRVVVLAMSVGRARLGIGCGRGGGGSSPALFEGWVCVPWTRSSSARARE